jgi:hypothetical protein
VLWTTLHNTDEDRPHMHSRFITCEITIAANIILPEAAKCTPD